MSPSFAPTSMNAAITSVYIVIADWTPWIDVFRSATICEIETFMTLESSTITNCAAPRIISGSQLRFSVSRARGRRCHSLTVHVATVTLWPREESNLRTKLRRLPLCPLSYGAVLAKRSPPFRRRYSVPARWR